MFVWIIRDTGILDSQLPLSVIADREDIAQFIMSCLKISYHKHLDDITMEATKSAYRCVVKVTWPANEDGQLIDTFVAVKHYVLQIPGRV